MSSNKRSRSVAGERISNAKDSVAQDDKATAELRHRDNSNHQRQRSLSTAPTDRVPLGQSSSDKKDTKKSKGRFPASFETLADPQFHSPAKSHASPQSPAKGILKKSSSPIRPSPASYSDAKAPSSQKQPSFRPRSFSSLSFNPLFKDSTPVKSSPLNQFRTSTSETKMSGRASAKAKARDATAVYEVGPSDTKDKKNKMNGAAAKKANASDDEGSSSSDEESESSSSSEEESEDESDVPQKTAAPAAVGKKATATPTSKSSAATPASKSSSSDTSSESSDDSDDDTPQQKAKKSLPSRPAATNGANASSSSETSSESESDSESESGGAKVVPSKKTKEIPDSSTDSSSEEEEDSDEEMVDAPPSGQGSSSTPKSNTTKVVRRGTPEPPPSVMDGGFKLQKAQNMGQMASLLSEANAKGDSVWLLTHPSTTPLNLEVQKIFTSSDNQRNSIVPNGTKLTYPVASDGSNIHSIGKLPLLRNTPPLCLMGKSF